MPLLLISCASVFTMLKEEVTEAGFFHNRRRIQFTPLFFKLISISSDTPFVFLILRPVALTSGKKEISAALISSVAGGGVEPPPPLLLEHCVNKMAKTKMVSNCFIKNHLW